MKEGIERNEKQIGALSPNASPPGTDTSFKNRWSNNIKYCSPQRINWHLSCERCMRSADVSNTTEIQVPVGLRTHMWTVYEMAFYGRVLGISLPFLGCRRIQVLLGRQQDALHANLHADVAALLFFVGWASDFVNVHVDALWEAPEMTAPSSEKITNACDVKVADEGGFLSRCVGHERANLNLSCPLQDRVPTLHPNTDAPCTMDVSLQFGVQFAP